MIPGGDEGSGQKVVLEGGSDGGVLVSASCRDSHPQERPYTEHCREIEDTASLPGGKYENLIKANILSCTHCGLGILLSALQPNFISIYVSVTSIVGGG